MARYDTFSGIQGYLTDLAGLIQLKKDRAEAGYKRGERMQEWVILGHWRADTCGNFGKCTFEKGYKETPADWTFPKEGLPVIHAGPALWDLLGDKGEWSISSGMNSQLPSPHLLCKECGKGWALENAHDAVESTDDRVVPLTPGKSIADREADWKTSTDGVYFFGHDPRVRNEKYIDMTPHPEYKGDFVNKGGWRCRHAAFNPEGKYGGERLTRDYIAEPGDEASINVFVYEHRRCRVLRRARESREFFEDVFEKAGITDIRLNEIPNQYWPKGREYEGMPPWYLAQLPYGEIKIGWRKRVISIDWQSTKRNLEHLFKEEDVTKEPCLIHAWGKDKAIEYLKKNPRSPDMTNYIDLSCVFCKIVNGTIPAEVLDSSPCAIVIKDRAPLAKTHVLVVATMHDEDITKAPGPVTEQVLGLAVAYAQKHLPNGHRIVINTGDDGGQTVKHFHVHVLGGEKLKDL